MKNTFRKVGDKFYRVRWGEEVKYYKIQIVKVRGIPTVKPVVGFSYIETYEYIRKGDSKKKHKIISSYIPELNNKFLFFNTKIDMLIYLDTVKNISKLSNQVKHEIERSKINNPQFWI